MSIDKEANEGIDDRQLYHLEVEGEISVDWASWFGADAVYSVCNVGGRTAIEVSVVDQAELYGVLRQIHNLHLPLVFLACVNRREPENRGEI